MMDVFIWAILIARSGDYKAYEKVFMLKLSQKSENYGA